VAFTDLGTIGSGQNKTAANSISFTTTQAVSVGDIVVVQIATDNSASTSGTTNTHTSITFSGNTFTKVAEITNAAGAAAGGVTLSLWRCVITSAVASGSSFAAGFSFSPAAKCLSARRIQAATGATFTYSAAQTNNATGAPAALTVSGLTSTKQIFAIRSAGLESTATSISTQTTGWTLGADIGTSGGSAATNISTRAEYISTTGVTSITSQPGGTSGDGASIMFVITEEPSLLTLIWASGGNVNENSANGTVVGTVGNFTAGSTYSLFNDAGGRFSLNTSTGVVTVANSSLLDYETNTSHNITVRETLAGYSNSPKDTVLSVGVTNLTAPVSTVWGTGSTVVYTDDFSSGRNWFDFNGIWQQSSETLHTVGSATNNDIVSNLSQTFQPGTYTVNFDVPFIASSGQKLRVIIGSGIQNLTINSIGSQSVIITNTIADTNLSFSGQDSFSNTFSGQIDNLVITQGSTAADPSIASSSTVGTHLEDLSKLVDSSLSISGGTGSSYFELYDHSGTWGVRTKATLVAGSYTLTILDTTNGPSGSAEAKSDTLNLTVTSASSTYLYKGGSNRATKYKGNKTDAQIYKGTKTGIFAS
jgi:hypothetical protein